jgi:hypothetical protein
VSDVRNEDLLAEFEDIIRSQPPYATIRHNTPENLGWVGRAVAAIAAWNMLSGTQARGYAKAMRHPMARESNEGLEALVGLIYEARSSLRLATVGPVNTSIGQGLVFDYFDEIRKLIAPALKGILFIDPYLDADFVSRYLPHIQEGVTVRLLAREKLSSLLPAVAVFAQQHRSNIEVRSAQNFHDRYVIVDGMTCYQSGASFKDGGRNAPTTVTQITDAFVAVRDTYESLWASGEQRYPTL